MIRLTWSMGPIVIELYWLHAPETCRNFAELARRGYYNGTHLWLYSLRFYTTTTGYFNFYVSLRLLIVYFHLGIKFHRIIADFMIQTGDPTGILVNYILIRSYSLKQISNNKIDLYDVRDRPRRQLYLRQELFGRNTSKSKAHWLVLYIMY
jgi:hypothetical protein